MNRLPESGGPDALIQGLDVPHSNHPSAVRIAPLMPISAVLSDAEVDDICAGLRQNAAKARYLRDVLNVPVQRKPNGRPLVLRCDWERHGRTSQDDRGASRPKWSKAA